MSKEKDPFKKLYINILKNGVTQDENGEWNQITSSVNRKRMQETNWIPPKIILTPIDLENKWHEQNGKCHWTGMEMDLGLLFNDHENHAPMHPLAPSVDKINPDGDYEYENIVLCVRMMNLGRSTYSFDKFYKIMIELTESLISNKTSPDYIKKYFTQKMQQENMKKQIEAKANNTVNLTWEDMILINPQLKDMIKDTT
jgi:hypothetical protein